MKPKYTLLALSFCAPFFAASADESDRKWTVSTNVSWSQISMSDRDAISGSVSLSRQIGDVSVGGSIGTSNGSDALFDGQTVTDRSSVFGSAFVSWSTDFATLNLNASYGSEEFEGRLILDDGRYEILNGAEVDLVSDVDSVSVNAGISKTLILGDWDVIPRAGFGWSQSASTNTVTAIDGLTGSEFLDEDQTGLSGTIGIGIGYVATERVYLFSDITGLYTENGASNGFASASRQGGLRASGRQDPEESAWAELSLGASFTATDRITLSLTGGTTAGRDDEEVFVSSSLSFGF